MQAHVRLNVQGNVQQNIRPLVRAHVQRNRQTKYGGTYDSTIDAPVTAASVVLIQLGSKACSRGGEGALLSRPASSYNSGMSETRHRPWLCHHCGVLLDTVGVVRGADAVPEQVELAVAVCIGYLDGHAWRPLRAEELAALAPAGAGATE